MVNFTSIRGRKTCDLDKRDFGKLPIGSPVATNLKKIQIYRLTGEILGKRGIDPACRRTVAQVCEVSVIFRRKVSVQHLKIQLQIEIYYYQFCPW